MDDCIFCKIVDDKIPSNKVYEDSNFIAFLDIKPLNKGHTLIIPKKHYETFNDIPSHLMEEFMKKIQMVSIGVVKATDAKGYNIYVNNHKTGGQEVPHVHFHILPRHEDDGISFSWPSKGYADKEIDKYAKIISEKI